MSLPNSKDLRKSLNKLNLCIELLETQKRCTDFWKSCARKQLKKKITFYPKR